MERFFKTLVREDHKFGMNDYVLGRVSGILEVICDGKRNGIDEPGVDAMWEIPGVGSTFTTLCEPEQYEQFANLIEKHYPGLCIFNYGTVTKEEVS